MRFSVLALIAAVVLIAPPDAGADQVFGLKDGDPSTIIRFSTATPGTITGEATLTGLATGETLLGIDVRPLTGQLMAISNLGIVYTVDPVSGVATAVGPPGSPTPSGTSFGFDFNPTVDRIRLTSDTNQNMRIHPDTGAVAFADTPLNPIGAAVTGSAYQNSAPGATTTLLFDIDTTGDALKIQNPPNDGTLATVGVGLGVNATGVGGFDIETIPGPTNRAFAALTVAGVTALYTVDLVGGGASLVGAIGTGTSPLRGLAVAEPLTVTPASLAFPATPLGTASAPLTVTVKNNTTSDAIPLDAYVSALTGTAPSDFEVTADACGQPGPLMPGETCTFAVRFTPSAAGARTGTALLDSAAPYLRPVALSGEGGSLPAGPTGPAGAGGPPGPAGPAGPAGPEREVVPLVVVAGAARLAGRAGRRVRVRYALTAAADVRLQVKRGKKTVATVLQKGRSAGRNQITWKGRVGRKRARPGRYGLVLRAVAANGVQATDTVRLTLRRR